MQYFMMLMTFVPVVFISVFIPYVTRRTESFGVSIPEDVYHSGELAAMRKRYAFLTALFGIVVMVAWVLFSLFMNEAMSGAAFAIAIFLFLVGQFAIYLIFHSQMKRLKAAKKWYEQKPAAVAVDTTFRDHKVAYSNGWFVVPLLITMGTVITTFLFYGRIPERIPVRYGFDGEVANYADKSYSVLLKLPAIQLFLTGLFVFLNTMIARYKQQIDVSNPERSIKQNVVFRRRWSLFTIVTGTAVVLMMFLVQLSYIVPFDPIMLQAVSFIVTGGIIIGCIVLSFTTGQGGSRVKTVEGRKGETVNRDDDRYWKLGVFYFNPDDPAIWIEKRFGVGWTINFAHPAGWGSLLVIILVTVLISIRS